MNRFFLAAIVAMPVLAAVILVMPSTAAAAPKGEDLTGTIAPGLRRKVELVYVEKVPGKFPPPAQPAVMNQARNVYVPRLLPVLQGTTVEFRSEDPELHNVFGRAEKKVLFNQGVPPKTKASVKMADLGVVKLSCNIHREMTAFIPVLQNPYFTQPDQKSGEFTIKAVPPGSYQLRLWGEKLTDEEKARAYPVTVGGSKSTHPELAAL
jgi:plastocyanin